MSAPEQEGAFAIETSVPRALHAGSTDAHALHDLLIDSVTEYAIFALDPAGHVVSWNPGAQRLKGYTTDEILGRHFSVFFPDEDARAGRPQLELEHATRLGRYEEEGWRLRKDGSRFWASVVLTPLRAPDGALLGFGKITRDLTDRRAAESRALELARESAARAEAERRRDELARLSEQLREQAVELEAQMEEAQALSEELEVANEELHIALERAETAEGFTRSILDSIAEPFVVHDRDWRFRYLNRAAERVFAASGHAAPGEMAGRVVWEVYPELLGTTFEREMRRAAADRVPVSCEAHYAVRDEWLRLVCYPLPDGGLATQWTDITSEKRGELERAALYQEQVQARAEAEEARLRADAANRAKTEFLTMMSHELRTPLNAIVGYAQLLEHEVRGPVSADQRHDLHRIAEAARHLLSLINALLDQSKIEAGRMEFRIADVHVQSLLEAVEPLVAPQLRSRALTFHCEPCAPTLVVRADRNRALQILVNLVSNAVKFSESGEIAISAREAGDRVEIHVRDCGPGIPPDQLERIFEPFVRLEAEPHQPREGMGLGLAISRSFARGMGGDLVAESALGSGSTFTLSLRRSAGEAAGA